VGEHSVDCAAVDWGVDPGPPDESACTCTPMTPTDPTPDIATLLANAIREADPDFAHAARMILATPSGKAILDRLARAEAALDRSPWRGSGGKFSTCFWCGGYQVLGRPDYLGHNPDCKWLAARPAR
jgi:hypothetical protein